jgi:hypothetical protein
MLGSFRTLALEWAMTNNSYDIAALLARSEHWRQEAARAPSPSVREFCLNEAARVEQMVNRSIAIPVLGSGGWESGRTLAVARSGRQVRSSATFEGRGPTDSAMQQASKHEAQPVGVP